MSSEPSKGRSSVCWTEKRPLPWPASLDCSTSPPAPAVPPDLHAQGCQPEPACKPWLSQLLGLLPALLALFLGCLDIRHHPFCNILDPFRSIRHVLTSLFALACPVGYSIAKPSTGHSLPQPQHGTKIRVPSAPCGTWKTLPKPPQFCRP